MKVTDNSNTVYDKHAVNIKCKWHQKILIQTTKYGSETRNNDNDDSTNNNDDSTNNDNDDSTNNDNNDSTNNDKDDITNNDNDYSTNNDKDDITNNDNDDSTNYDNDDSTNNDNDDSTNNDNDNSKNNDNDDSTNNLPVTSIVFLMLHPALNITSNSKSTKWVRPPTPNFPPNFKVTLCKIQLNLKRNHIPSNLIKQLAMLCQLTYQHPDHRSSH
jgi:hypothetical protein